jgi:hypothetical protein
LLRCSKQASEPEKLRSSLRCNASKLRSRRSSGEASELAVLQQASFGAPEKLQSVAASKFRSRRSSGEALELVALLASSNKTNTKKKKKVSILPDRGRVGLMGARAPAPTPQQQLHSSTTTAPQQQLHNNSSTAPQQQLQLHSFRSTSRALAME